MKAETLIGRSLAVALLLGIGICACEKPAEKSWRAASANKSSKGSAVAPGESWAKVPTSQDGSELLAMRELGTQLDLAYANQTPTITMRYQDGKLVDSNSKTYTISATHWKGMLASTGLQAHKD